MDVLHLWQRTVCHITQISEGQKKALYRKWGLRVFHVVSWKREVDMSVPSLVSVFVDSEV